MVKRTLVVLGVLSLTLMVAGTSFGFIGGGGCGTQCGGPLYVPVDCPDMGVAKTIVKTWECKIEGPCPAPTPACGSSCKTGPRPGMLCSLFTAIAHPCEMLFGGFDGVYGCLPGFGGGAGCGCCGGGLGGLGGFFGSGSAMLSGDSTIFGALW